MHRVVRLMQDLNRVESGVKKVEGEKVGWLCRLCVKHYNKSTTVKCQKLLVFVQTFWNSLQSFDVCKFNNCLKVLLKSHFSKMVTLRFAVEHLGGLNAFMLLALFWVFMSNFSPLFFFCPYVESRGDSLQMMTYISWKNNMWRCLSLCVFVGACDVYMQEPIFAILIL